MEKVAQAGAIAVKPGNGEPLVLITTAKDNPAHWLFPKGHVEPGETAREAAIRELREETGVVGEYVGQAGRNEFTRNGKLLSVEYFVLRFVGQTEAEEGRQIQWVSVSDAQAILTFAGIRQVLADAVSLVDQAAAASEP